MGHLRLVALTVLAAAPLLPQASSTRTPEQLKALYAAHKSDFDYLLGDWAFTSESLDYGKFSGRWSAARLDTGQILDEYRVVGDNAETVYVTSTIRAYNAAADRWELIGMDSGGAGLQDFGTGQRVNSEMHIEQKFGVAGGKPVTLRIRYYNIQADRFSWSADRSADGGQTWVKNVQKIEARRIGPSRTLGPLAPAKKPSGETMPTDEAANSAVNQFGGAAPIFCVASVRASIDYYVNALGFTVNWDAGGFASVGRDRCRIFLCEQGQGHPGAWAWIGVTDADTLAGELRNRGAKIRRPPTNYPWAYEMQVEDPDGNVLRFGSDSKKGEPFGPFLDMHGRLWPVET